MKPRNGAVMALLLLATCNEESQVPVSPTVESAREALGKLPASEVATWTKVGSSTIPDGRYLQATAFDESRKVVVMFGGEISNPNMGTGSPSQETWEWSPITGKWNNRTATGSAPDARSGAAMVYDSTRGKFVLFGGRAGSGYNYEDTWEWDPATGVWTDITAAGSHPSARAQHGMVYEKSTGKILLFGGGRSDSASYDGSGITVSIGDTWEFDPTTHVWAAISIATGATSPTARHDFGMVWDSTRKVAVLFAGMQTDIASASGVPKRDTWEFDPAARTWTERTAVGSKPSERYGHAMAFDGSRGKVVLFGGWDMTSGGSLNDVWDWDPATGTWTERLAGNAPNLPSPRMYASLVSDDARGRLEVLAGLTMSNSGKGGMGGTTYFPGTSYGTNGSNEVWELDPVAATFTDRSTAIDVPPARTDHCMAYNPATGKVYVFGGYDMTGQVFDDLWEWDGKVWAQVVSDVSPPARSDAALAYDPARKSLILFGGTNYYGSSVLGDTWEWNSTSRKWSQLTPTVSPDALYTHAMVTDTTRGKILLFGGMSNYYYSPDLGTPYKDPLRNEIWEWDGNKVTWTNRTPVASTATPVARQFPILAYDEGRQKMFLFDGPQYSNYPASLSAFWEWDPISAGWALRDPGDALDSGYSIYVAYDSIRKREVLLTDATSNATGNYETWEIDAKGPTFYVRALPGTPSSRYSATMVFDSARGVMVLFGGSTGNGYSDETWEYNVTGWGNGEGCNATFATSCASGNCVDGVCCDSAACTGPCKSCSVAGSEGTCVLAKAGTEVTGSCANGQACDGSGNCLSGNGQACTSAATCASGFCTDGVCCNSACNGVCASCNLAGQAGKCSPYAAGTDPQNECGKGTGVCKSTCDGVGSCAYPQAAVPCASCTVCDGYGSCSQYDPYCAYTGGAGGGFGGSIGGSGGYNTGRGGATIYGGSGGYTTVRGGSGGYATNYGGSGGYTTVRGGSGGSGGYFTTYGTGGAGGYTNARGGSGGYTTLYATGGATTIGSGGRTGGVGGAILGTGGSIIIGSGGGIGTGGSSGKLDGGAPKDGSTGVVGPDGGGIDGITEARLHRSGCSCDLGRSQQIGSIGFSAPFILVGAALLRRRTQRKKQNRRGGA
jgi:hypothetical protein